MSKEEMQMEKLYQTTMLILRDWLEQGLITEEEYAIIDTKMKAKYRPIIGTLFSDISLL